DIRLLGGEQYAPARSKREVRNQLWCVLHHVMHMQRLEELRILRVVAAPDVPAACPTLRRMPKSIERQLRERRKRDTQTIVLCGRLKERTKVVAYLRLR